MNDTALFIYSKKKLVIGSKSFDHISTIFN